MRHLAHLRDGIEGQGLAFEHALDAAARVGPARLQDPARAIGGRLMAHAHKRHGKHHRAFRDLRQRQGCRAAQEGRDQPAHQREHHAHAAQQDRDEPGRHEGDHLRPVGAGRVVAHADRLPDPAAGRRGGEARLDADLLAVGQAEGEDRRVGGRPGAAAVRAAGPRQHGHHAPIRLDRLPAEGDLQPGRGARPRQQAEPDQQEHEPDPARRPRRDALPAAPEGDLHACSPARPAASFRHRRRASRTPVTGRALQPGWDFRCAASAIRRRSRQAERSPIAARARRSRRAASTSATVAAS